MRILDVRSRQDWRNWLAEHHHSEPGIWLVFHKQHAAEASIGYDDAVEEALCFGWIDSIVKRLDDHRYARKFTPRKPGSKWSTINRKRYADLKARGLLAAPGLDRPPTSRSGDARRPSVSAIPAYIEKQLRANSRAWEFFWTAGAFISAALHSLDRFGQTRGDEAETSSRSDQSAGRW